MFIDYYSILEIDINSNSKTIKLAYKNQALKWHPDKNPGVDTTQRMQLINEAYLILNDSEARSRYDVEYLRYYEFQKQNKRKEEDPYNNSKQKNKEKYDSESYEENNYNIYDETLYKWILNAKKQAAILAQKSLEDLIGMSKAGAYAMGDAFLEGVVRFFIVGLIMFVVFKACN